MSVCLAFALQDHSHEPFGDSVLAQLTEDWSVPVTEVARQDGTLSFRFRDLDVVWAEMPAPYPGDELAAFASDAWLWPKASVEVSRQTSHSIVTVLGGASAVERAKVMTQVLSSLSVPGRGVLGVLVGQPQPQLVRSDVLRELAMSETEGGLQSLIWVRARSWSAQQGGTHAFTSGMQGLGLPEFEVENAPESPEALSQRLRNLVDYQIESAGAIQDGHSVGNSAEERIRVKLSPAKHSGEGQVLRLDFPSTSKPFWKFW